jgi:hypothetical protein
MALPIPPLLQGEMFFDYTVNQLWIGTLTHGNQQIPLETLNGITFPDNTVQTTAASGGGAVSSVFGRTGAVVAQAADYAANYDPLGAATAVFKQASVTLTSAQLLALSTTPITIIPAPGAGFYIAPSYGYMQYHFGGTAYTSPAVGNDCYLLYGPPPEVNPTNLIMLYDWAATASGIIKATASTTFIFICGEGLVPYTTCNNAAVTFSAPNALGAGNGTLTITLNYSILPLP